MLTLFLLLTEPMSVIETRLIAQDTYFSDFVETWYKNPPLIVLLERNLGQGIFFCIYLHLKWIWYFLFVIIYFRVLYFTPKINFNLFFPHIYIFFFFFNIFTYFLHNLQIKMHFTVYFYLFYFLHLKLYTF